MCDLFIFFNIPTLPIHSKTFKLVITNLPLALFKKKKISLCIYKLWLMLFLHMKSIMLIGQAHNLLVHL